MLDTEITEATEARLQQVRSEVASLELQLAEAHREIATNKRLLAALEQQVANLPLTPDEFDAIAAEEPGARFRVLENFDALGVHWEARRVVEPRFHPRLNTLVRAGLKIAKA